MKKCFKRISLLFVSSLLPLGFASCDDNPSGQGGDEVVDKLEDADGSAIYYVSMHYRRDDGKENNWELYAWGDFDGSAHEFYGKDSYGVYWAGPMSTFFNKFVPESSQLGFIIRTAGSWDGKDATSSDRFVKFSRLTPDENNIFHIYLKGGDKTIYSSANGDVIAEVDNCKFTASYSHFVLKGSYNIASFALYEDKKLIYEETLSKATTDQITRDIVGEGYIEEIDIEKPYYCDVTFANGETVRQPVSYNNLYGTNKFQTLYNYDGELGTIYKNTHTIFRVWSPVSQEVKLRIYENGTPTEVDDVIGSDEYKEYIMDRKEQGVYEIDLYGDLEGKYYTYVVTNHVYTNKEVVDPYAKSAGVNGARGMVVNFNSTKAKPNGWDDIDVLPYEPTELVVYETHVADVTSSTTWGGTPSKAKRFEGMYESGTTYSANGTPVTTGFDHIKELGVNAIQLLPIFDQSNDEVNTSFNWGYNPQNYNVLEGSYSSDPYDGYARIKEFKELVMAYNKAGINIIMDVVYNHLYSANQSNFDVLMPGYYFRYKEEGGAMILADGSGCGNETNSDNYMYRKFMIDSTTFWASEYKLGGFRFDLMGLHDITTMNELTAACKEIFPNIAIYGEPWSASDASTSKPANQYNAGDYEGYGAFNDRIRESLMKTNTLSEWGWAYAGTALQDYDVQRIANGIQGKTVLDRATLGASQTVNYVSCHDNRTVYDRLAYAGADANSIPKMATLANAVVMTSKGISFMQAGEEFLRSKGGDENSYASGYETNALDYSRKITYSDVFENFKNLIEVKTSVTYFKEDESNAADVQWVGNGFAGGMLRYSFISDGRNYIVYHRNGYGSGTQTVSDLSGYTCMVDTLGYVKKGATFSGSYGISNFETIVAYK